MPDEETPTPPRGGAPDDDGERAPVIGGPEIGAESPPDEDTTPEVPPAWTPPAAPAADRTRAPRGRASSGGWFGRLRALVGGSEPAAPPPPPAPWRSPGAAEERGAPDVPVFEAPPRPALLETPPALDLPAPARPSGGAPPAAPSPGALTPEPPSPPPAPTAEPRAAGPSSWRFGQPPTEAATAVTPPDAPSPPVASPRPEPAEGPSADQEAGVAGPPEAAASVEAAVETRVSPVTPEAETPSGAEEPTAVPQVEAATEAEQPETGPAAQPPLFHTPPAEPQPVVAEFAPLPTPEELAEVIEEAIEEAEATIERPPAETPEEREFPPVPPLTALAEDLPLPDPDAETPEEAAEEQREAEVIAKGGPFSRFAWPSHPHYWNGYLAVITGLATLSFLMFVLVEPSPRWILLIVALGVAAGMDGVLRATWRSAFERGEDTTPSLVLPALYVFAAPLIIEHNVTGHAVIWWALVAGIGFGAIAVAEVLSVRTGSRLYPHARLVVTGAAYFTAFSLLSLTYVLEMRLVPAFLATGLIGAMLAVEVVREGEVDPVETAIFAGLTGLVLAQVRWLLFFLPLDGYLAGLTLVLTFYFVTGVLHSYVLRQLNLITATEYALVATIGMVLVGAARVAGLA